MREEQLEIFRNWVKEHYFQLSIFNMILVMLLLLRSAGYFEPYLALSVNLIVFIALIGMVTLLKARVKTLIIVTIFFWIFAGALKILGVDIWAERTAIYAFEALLIAIVLLIIE